MIERISGEIARKAREREARDEVKAIVTSLAVV